MDYARQNFTDGQTLTAAQLNHIEDGILELEEELANTSEKLETLSTQFNGNIIPATVE